MLACSHGPWSKPCAHWQLPPLIPVSHWQSLTLTLFRKSDLASALSLAQNLDGAKIGASAPALSFRVPIWSARYKVSVLVRVRYCCRLRESRCTKESVRYSTSCIFVCKTDAQRNQRLSFYSGTAGGRRPGAQGDGAAGKSMLLHASSPE